MPPKQVYGKRAASKTTTAYAKFISPDKDGLLTQEAKTASKPRRGTAQARIVKDMEPSDQDKENNIAAETVPQKVREKTQGLRKGVGNAKQPTKEVDVVDLIGDLNALTIQEKEKISEQEESSCQRKPPRRAGQTVLEKRKNGKPSATESHSHTWRQSSPGASTHPHKVKHTAKSKRACSPPMELPHSPDARPQLANPYETYLSPLISLGYDNRVIPFQEWSATLEPHFLVTKIAEASFSEVYRLTDSSASNGSAKESVLKLVALKEPPNLSPQNDSQTRKSQARAAREAKEIQVQDDAEAWKSHVDDVASEVRLLQNLNSIPGFTNFREVTLLQGRPSAVFINAWKTWNKSRPRGKKSEFPDPGKRASYKGTQLWAVIEMQDAGSDCEKVMAAGGLNTVWEIWDVFWGVCLSVAKAEEACNFEHRDLHLENICIKSSRSDSDDDLTRPLIRDPLHRKLGFTGLETTVIDYTLSRADVLLRSSSQCASLMSATSDGLASSDATLNTPSLEREIAFLDLNKDMGIFNGDASEEYQYEIYRYMRGAVLYDDPLQSTPSQPSIPVTPRRSPRKTAQHIRFDDAEPKPSSPPLGVTPEQRGEAQAGVWRHFHPKTNLVWAHFILHQLLKHLQGSRPEDLSSKQIMRNMEASIEDKSRVVKKAHKLQRVLDEVAQLLRPSALGQNSLGSMKELVVLAMEKRWLRVDDVAGR